MITTACLPPAVHWSWLLTSLDDWVSGGGCARDEKTGELVCVKSQDQNTTVCSKKKKKQKKRKRRKARTGPGCRGHCWKGRNGIVKTTISHSIIPPFSIMSPQDVAVERQAFEALTPPSMLLRNFHAFIKLPCFNLTLLHLGSSMLFTHTYEASRQRHLPGDFPHHKGWCLGPVLLGRELACAPLTAVHRSPTYSSGRQAELDDGRPRFPACSIAGRRYSTGRTMKSLTTTL